MIDLVRDEQRAVGVAPGGKIGEFRGREDRPGGVRRAGDDQPGRRPVELFEHVDRRLKTRFGTTIEFEYPATQRRKRVPVCRITRPGHGHRVARIKCSKEDQGECTG